MLYERVECVAVGEGEGENYCNWHIDLSIICLLRHQIFFIVMHSYRYSISNIVMSH